MATTGSCRLGACYLGLELRLCLVRMPHSAVPQGVVSTRISALSCSVSAYEHKWNAADAFIGLEMLNVAMAECSVATNHLSWGGGKRGK